MIIKSLIETFDIITSRSGGLKNFVKWSHILGLQFIESVKSKNMIYWYIHKRCTGWLQKMWWNNFFLILRAINAIKILKNRVLLFVMTRHFKPSKREEFLIIHSTSFKQPVDHEITNKFLSSWFSISLNPSHFRV